MLLDSKSKVLSRYTNGQTLGGDRTRGHRTGSDALPAELRGLFHTYRDALGICTAITRFRNRLVGPRPGREPPLAGAAAGAPKSFSEER